MLIPQFSIRWMLAATLALALVSSMFALALQGYQWAVGISIGIFALMLTTAVWVVLFGLLWAATLWSPWLRRRRNGASQGEQNNSIGA
jgi:hypothetical protein